MIVFNFMAVTPPPKKLERVTLTTVKHPCWCNTSMGAEFTSYWSFGRGMLFFIESLHLLTIQIDAVWDLALLC